MSVQKIGYWIFLAGAALTILATALGHAECARRGAALWSISIALFAVNFIKICLHLVRGDSGVIHLKSALKGTA